MSIYCTYVTVYRGNKLPPFYIGSSSVEKVNNGYHGSVASKEYSKIWDAELKSSPHLFVTKILTIHDDRKAALAKELKLQKSLNVVTNSMYINKSLAAVNGFFGMQVPKEMHPSYGVEWSSERKLSHGEKRTNYFKNNKVVWINKNGITKQTTETNSLRFINDGWSLGRIPVGQISKGEVRTCPHCSLSGGKMGMDIWHFDNCKYHPDKLETTLSNVRIKKEPFKIEYYGDYYKTFNELKVLTGCSEHLYRKYYKNSLDPRPHFNSRNYRGNNTLLIS